jgi:predicted small secreted protein
MMKSRLMLLPALVLVAGLLAGCQDAAGVGSTWSDKNNDFRRVATLDGQMFVDDLGLLFQTDRPMHTSRWYVD